MKNLRKKKEKEKKNIETLKEKYSNILFKNKYNEVNNYLDETYNETCDKFKMDEFCEMFEYVILIWNNEIKDIEYFGKKLFGDTFKKDNWNLYSKHEIVDKLKEIEDNITYNIEDDGFKFLKYFLNKPYYSYDK